MPRYLMTVAYDGTLFHGWQVQPGQRTVQEALQNALQHFGNSGRDVIAAGRTDTGVHALGQKAHFDYSGSMDCRQLKLAFRTKLPLDVDVTDVIVVPDTFHARYHACEREYRYLLAKQQTPFNRNHMGAIARARIDSAQMYELCEVLLGKHDFSSFGRPNPAIPNRLCDLRILKCREKEDHYEFQVVADRYLHNMVRRIVGTLVNFCVNQTSPELLKDILEQCDPRQTMVPTAPACGLYLYRVAYPDIGLD